LVFLPWAYSALQGREIPTSWIREPICFRKGSRSSTVHVGRQSRALAPSSKVGCLDCLCHEALAPSSPPPLSPCYPPFEHREGWGVGAASVGALRTERITSFYKYCGATRARSLTRLKTAESRDDAFAGKGSRRRLRHSHSRARRYASLRYKRSRIAFLRSWFSSLSLPRVAFSELVLASGSLHAGQRLANPGLPGLSSNSSEQIAQTFIGNVTGSPKSTGIRK